MEEIVSFATDNYVLLTIITCILVLSLIGYIIEKRNKNDVKIKQKNIIEEAEKETINLVGDVQNQSINDLMNKNNTPTDTL